jgi:hypothetical protein
VTPLQKRTLALRRLHAARREFSYASREPARAIIAAVARKYGLTYDDLIGSRRLKPLVIARQEAMHILVRARPDLGLTRVGRLFNRDHSTVWHAIRQDLTRHGSNPDPVSVTSSHVAPPGSKTPNHGGVTCGGQRLASGGQC